MAVVMATILRVENAAKREIYELVSSCRDNSEINKAIDLISIVECQDCKYKGKLRILPGTERELVCSNCNGKNWSIMVSVHP